MVAFRLLRPLLVVALSAIGAAAFCLFLLQAVSGGPFATEQLADPLLRANLDAAFGISRPWWEQWGAWIFGVVHGSLGTSFQHRGVEVSTLLADAWPTTLALGTTALAIGIAVAVPGAVVVARTEFAAATQPVPSRIRKTLAALPEALASGVLCLPSFVSAPLLLALVVSRHSSGGVPAVSDPVMDFLLAAVVLSLPVAATSYRWLRLGLREATSAPWWTSIRARSMSDHRRWWRYALGSTWPTLAGRLSSLAAEVLTGALAVETVFGLPGLGRLLGTAALHRDAPVLVAAVGCSVATVMTLQMLAELPWPGLSARVGDPP